jgi:hypothetical protein
VLSRAAPWGGRGRKKPPQGFLAALKRLRLRFVVDEGPAPGPPHQAGIAKNPQMLGDGALRDAELQGQRADAEGAAGNQTKDAQTHLDGQGSQKT